MMFHSAFSLILIALVAGVALLIFVRNQSKNKWAAFVAWLVILLSSLMLICSVYHGIKHWPHHMHHGMWKHHHKMMDKSDMMKKMDMEDQEMKKEETAPEEK